MIDRPRDLWSLFGLRESPFFQETLAPGSAYPTELFVGRQDETRRIVLTTESSPSSRQLIHGPPGIGKTTLAQHAKDILSQRGFIVRWRPVGLTAGQTAAGLLVEILASVHESILTALPASAGPDPMEAARGLVRAFRQSSLSGGVSVLGSGLQAGRDVTYVRPVAAAIAPEAWRLLLELSRAASADHRAAGLVVHLNNLENLTTSADLESAALVFRDLRDLFLAPGLHWIVVGTTEASHGLLGAFPQVRSVFLPSHPPLQPLAKDEFVALLAARYRHLRIEGSRLIPPVEDQAAAAVYSLFRGDLRGAFRTLEQGCLALAGLTEGEPVRSLRYSELTDTLRPIYAAGMLSDLSDAMVERLRGIASARGEGVTQWQLEETWEVSRQRVSQVLGELERRGYLRRAGVQDRSRLYTLTGTGLIALGLAETE